MTALCQCGCGQLAPIAQRTWARYGWVSGQPLRFIHGHNSRVQKPLAHRLADRSTRDASGCWVWDRPGANGYGYLAVDGSDQLVHRLSYETFVGPIPDGLQIDHLCRNKACINPEHLEPVTQAENLRRWAETVTHCPRNHPYDAENTYWRRDRPGSRQCKACNRLPRSTNGAAG